MNSLAMLFLEWLFGSRLCLKVARLETNRNVMLAKDPPQLLGSKWMTINSQSVCLNQLTGFTGFFFKSLTLSVWREQMIMSIFLAVHSMIAANKIQGEQKIAKSYGASCCTSLEVSDFFLFSISSVTLVGGLNYRLHETAVILLVISSESLKHSVNSTRSTVGRSKEPLTTTSYFLG